MKNNKTFSFLVAHAIISIVLVFLLTSCAEKPITTPDKEGLPSKEAKKTEQELREQKKLYDVLMKEGHAYASKEQRKDALLIYNQAMTLALDDDTSAVIERIESVLAGTHPLVIEEFLSKDDIQIPKPLLLYWLGTNYASKKEYKKEKTVLSDFMGQYPDHQYYNDAKALLTLIKKTVFKSDTIGCLLPLSGKYAVFGQRALMGIQTAIDDLSDQYGKQFHIVIKDTRSDGNTAVECVQELHQANVSAILGPLLTVNEAGQEAEKLGIPMIALTQKNDFPLQGKYLFSNFITPEMQAQTLGAYAFMELGIKKVAILYPEERYGVRYMNLFWNVVNEFDGQVVGVESYDGKKTDFTKPIQKLTGAIYPVPEFLKPKPLEMNPEVMYPDLFISPEGMENQETSEKKEEKIEIDFEAIFIPDSPSIINMILPQLAYNDVTGIYLLGTNLWHNNSLLSESKGYNRKAVITDGFFKESKNTITAQFAQKFQSLFQKEPGFIEAISYDTASILFTAAMDEQVGSRESLKDALQGSRIFEGVTGKTIFDKEGHAHKELFLMTIKKGKFVEISR